MWTLTTSRPWGCTGRWDSRSTTWTGPTPGRLPPPPECLCPQAARPHGWLRPRTPAHRPVAAATHAGRPLVAGAATCDGARRLPDDPADRERHARRGACDQKLPTGRPEP